MKTSFICESCSETLQADEALAGRVITCPFCRKTTRLVMSSAQEKNDQGSPEDDFEFDLDSNPLSDPDATSSERPNDAATMTLAAAPIDGTAAYPPPADEDLDFALEGNVALDVSNAQVNEAMRELIPNFEPNPFGFSFPLEKTEPENALDDDYDEQTGSSSNIIDYDVDELIKGVD